METIKAIKTHIRAAVAPQSFDEEENTFDVTFTTSAPVRRYDWQRDTYYNEVLSFDTSHVNLSRLNSKAPVLDNHDRYTGVTAQIGVVEKAWVENEQGGATIRFSKREDVKGIVQDVKDGILANISIGYAIKKVEREFEEGQDIPTYRAVDWEPFEISLVPVPADPAAQIRSIENQLQTIEIVGEKVELKKENTDHTAESSLACLDILLTINK